MIATLFVFASVMLASTAGAQGVWTVTSLRTADATRAYANAASGGQQAGDLTLDGVSRASLWNGTAASWVDLNPAGSTGSQAYAAAGGQQAGYAIVGGVRRASLWSGTAASWVDLHPAGVFDSTVFGAGGGQQVGQVRLTGSEAAARASLWSGTAPSWVNLHPAGTASYSRAYATSGGQQAGYTVVGGLRRASLWSGTAASWVDLHPAGAYESVAYAISGGQQAGSVQLTANGPPRASLWSGTAASWVDLSPPGSSSSEAQASSGGQQVGYANVNGLFRAILWSGTAASWVDLHAFLPPGFFYSFALGISGDGVNTYVVGYGASSTTGRVEALLWKLAPNGLNLIANPGFEAGPTAFASDYAYSAGGNCCEGEYTVRDVGNTFNGAFVNPPPASPGSVQMMVVNGSTVPNLRIWYQNLTVTPGTRYRLALRGCTAVAGGPAVLQWQINGALIGSPVTLPSVTGQWVDVGAVWTAPAGVGAITLAVRNLNTATFPNDFYLDDLSMTPECVADFDDGSGTGTRDGGVGIEDLLYYLGVYDAGTSRADVDDGTGTGTPDGGVGIEDLLYYLTRYDAGC